MGKKQDTKAREQVVAQRSAQLRVVEAAASYTPEELEVMLPEWRVFLTAFPTVQAAIEAVSAGRAVEVFSHERAAFRRQVLQGPDGVVVEDRLYPHQWIQCLIATAWLNHPAPGEETADAIKAFLWSIVPDGTDLGGMTVVKEEGTGPVPVFGYCRAVSAERLTAWEEADEHNAFGLLYKGMTYLSDDRVDVTDEMVEDLRAHGLPVRVCGQCEDFVTNRHPSWPGVWVALGEETGPLCHSAEDARNWDDLFTIAVHGPHRVH
ncbi:hypothetical protein [Kitasatospora cathayae]|uniref:Uncharacterized protein n=1 Tax=Kitasatospora cathayae TaxID=3004092 RepID=A0ABY7QHY1_9ACTN|nr:hypothetical protein [Kitasatospora sp. HUAS 3-15]WBP91962.1 hypothetical protein O1G21_39925 [Kitasatospora sp. HUAS 3-15]